MADSKAESEWETSKGSFTHMSVTDVGFKGCGLGLYIAGAVG